MRPFLSAIPALVDAPIKVPKVSNKSMNNSVNTTIRYSTSKAKNREKSNFKATGPIDDGKLTKEKSSGICVTPKGIPIKVISKMVMNKAPFTFSLSKAAPIKIPATATSEVGVQLQSDVMVESLATITPPFFKPI